MSLVIVAIPQQNDPVWQISSEKVPHLTLLFLGDNVDKAVHITLFVEHAAKIGLTRFGLDVDRRGTLGPDNADVLFFQDNWTSPRVRQFRELLLKEPTIKTAWDSVQQFGAPQEWTPHLTLGYPTSPAKKYDHSIYWVQFDRIAVWTGDYSGPEFILDKHQFDYPEVAMSDTSAYGRQFLAHHGVLGMRWGHRKPESVSSESTNTAFRGRAKVKTEGGTIQPAHPDAVKVAEHKQKMKKSGMSALSNQELQDLQQRMQLEANVKRLNVETASRGRKFIQKGLGNYTNQVGQEFVNESVRTSVKKANMANAKYRQNKKFGPR